MQSAILRDIQESVRKEDYNAALILCEAALTKSECQTFYIYNILGNCAQQSGDKVKARSAFESALQCSDANTPPNVMQSQKVWKVGILLISR